MKLLLPIPCRSCQGFYVFMDFAGKNSIIQNIGEYNDGEVQVGDEGAGRGRTRKRVENSGSFATPSVAVAECPRDLREENLQSSALRSTVAKASQLFKA
jgi:hypothetical protein